MGDYTTNHAFYKPSSDEFVDVESQINYNFSRADERVRSIAEWQYTELPIISGFLNRDVGYKFFKASTGAFYVCPSSNLDLLQHSGNGDVDSWTTSGLTFVGGYQSENLNEQRISYRKEPTDGVVSWRGTLKLNSGADQIPLNTSTVVMTMPVGVRPARSKYFYVHMGIATAGYSCTRILFNATNGEVEINRMGINQSDASQRVISFNDVEYPTNDT